MTRDVPVDPAASRFRRFLESAPKAELHVHLRGAMPPEFFAGLLEKYTPAKALKDAPKRFLDAFQKCDNIRPFLHSPLKAPIQALFHYRSFDQFLATYLFTSYFCRDVTDFRNLIAAVRAELTRQNIIHAEITVSVFEYLNQGIAMEDLAEALDEGAGAPGVETLWIADLVRNIGPVKAHRKFSRSCCAAVLGAWSGSPWAAVNTSSRRRSFKGSTRRLASTGCALASMPGRLWGHEVSGTPFVFLGLSGSATAFGRSKTRNW